MNSFSSSSRFAAKSGAPASSRWWGSTGDSYDNAPADSVIGLLKTEEIDPHGPWKRLEDVEFATLEWVAWYNHRRLLAPLGYAPPAEFEQASYDFRAAPGAVAVLT